jgi:amidohydrolase
VELAEAKERVSAEVDRLAGVLLEASHQIHAHPELGYEEHFAHDLLTDVLELEGLPVERHAFGIDTAFASRAGDGGPVIAVMCEYDALPEIGHACGHNIIATAGLGAGLAAASVASEVGGRVLILGTPAEEGGGGKIRMAERGALDGVDAAMMVHPANADLDSMHTLAIRQLWVTYHGAAAHAAAFPHRGRNALDAAVLGYMNVAALRQHIRPVERIHGIFTKGGDKPNIVPELAAQQWYVRAAKLGTLEKLCERVLACLQAGADAAGCELEYEWKEPVYADMVDNRALIGAFVENARTLGRDHLDARDVSGIVGSTDMGNVSHQVPSIHPMVCVAPPDVSIHSAAFTEHARSEAGDRAVIDGAKSMAMTIADLWLRPDLFDRVRDEFTDTQDKPG